MSTEALAAGLTAHTKLLHHVIPELLRECGCAEEAGELVALLSVPDAGLDELVDALDVCASAALAAAAIQHLNKEKASRTERVAAVLQHLSQHHFLDVASPRASGMHLIRALDIAAELGHLPGPVGVAA